MLNYEANLNYLLYRTHFFDKRDVNLVRVCVLQPEIHCQDTI